MGPLTKKLLIWIVVSCVAVLIASIIRATFININNIYLPPTVAFWNEVLFTVGNYWLISKVIGPVVLKR